MNIDNFLFDVVRNPIVYGVFSFNQAGFIAPGTPEFIIAETDPIIEAEDGQLFITED